MTDFSPQGDRKSDQNCVSNCASLVASPRSSGGECWGLERRSFAKSDHSLIILSALGTASVVQVADHFRQASSVEEKILKS